MSKYLKRKRRKLTPEEEAEVQKIIRLTKSKEKSAPRAPEGFTFRMLTEDDAEPLAELYKVVFKTYPFPIFDPNYIKQTMKENIIYFGTLDADGNLVAASSAETDPEGLNVEMTDFATNPEYRGHSLALSLLYHMEREMKQRGFHVAYTIARAHSPGMNITFAKAGYQYGGTLIHNTHIAGDLETMNVWYKRL
jgi:putative beta-lysine N-acetyltransferase